MRRPCANADQDDFVGYKLLADGKAKELAADHNLYKRRVFRHSFSLQGNCLVCDDFTGPLHCVLLHQAYRRILMDKIQIRTPILIYPALCQRKLHGIFQVWQYNQDADLGGVASIKFNRTYGIV